ncbi:MAG: hypothetical protein RIF33_24330 [Cyclobacteriaceae bacterium]
MSKLFFICTLLLSMCYQGFSQNKSFVAVELLGHGAFYSLSYLHEMEKRDNGNFFGLRGGLSLMSTGHRGIPGRTVDIFIPLSTYYTFSKHWELGQGITPYLRFMSFGEGSIQENERRLHLLSFTSFGYRKNLGENWLFKASLSAAWYIGRPLNEMFPWPGLMFARRIK